MRAVIVAVAMAVVALAGCAEETMPVQDDEFSEEFDEELEATKDTGIIRGVVVDDTITPVAGVKVNLVGQSKSTETNAEGQFGFGDLEPGSYFVKVNKAGFSSVQQSVDVVAGVEKPPVVRVLIERIPGFDPYMKLQTYNGFYQCGTSVLVVCGAPNILLGDGTTDDTSTPTIYYDADPDFVQTEMVWRSTQALSPELYFEMEALDSGCTGGTFFTNAEGESPIKASVGNESLREHNVNPDDCGIYHSVFAGGAQGTPVGFSLEQKFTWYISEFHDYLPPEDWWFIVDGEVAPPE